MPAFGLGFGLTFAQPGGGVAAASPLLTDLVSYYKLENTSDSHASNTLTNTNAVTFTAGKLNNAATFDRALSQKLTATLTGLAASAAGSVAFWWRRNGATSGGAEGIVEVGTAASNSFLVYTGSNVGANKVGVYQFVSGSIAALINDTLALTDATWYHFALTWAAGTNEFKLYRDGAVAATSTMSAVTLGTGLAIGFGAVLSQYVKGQVDELGLWNRALTLAEVQQLYGSGTPPGYPTF